MYQHQPIVDYLMVDVIETYKKKLAQHCPTRANDKRRPHPLFLWAKLKWWFFNEVWFIIAPIGWN